MISLMMGVSGCNQPDTQANVSGGEGVNVESGAAEGNGVAEGNVVEGNAGNAAEDNSVEGNAAEENAESIMRIEGNPDITPGIYFSAEPTLLYAPENGGAYYPRLYELSDGTVLCGFDADLGSGGGSSVIQIISSTDMENWSVPVTVSDEPDLNCANAAMIQLENGDLLCAYRANGNRDGRDGYTSVRCSVSHDNGKTWEFHSVIAEEEGSGGVYEPHFGRIGEEVAVFYANDSLNVVNAHMEQNLEFKLLEGNGWSGKRIASDGTQTHSRDGMPVWDKAADGSYVLVGEATNEQGYPFVIQMKSSPDGLDWSEPFRNVYVPYQKGKKAGAPYILTLPDGRYALAFQTDDDANQTGDGASYMKVMFSLDTVGEQWTEPFVPFLIPETANANWNSLFLRGGTSSATLYAATSTNYPRGGLYLREAKLSPQTAEGQNIINNGMFVFKNTQNWKFATNGKEFHNEFPPKEFETKIGNHYLTISNRTENDIVFSQQIPGAAEGRYTFSVKAMGNCGDVKVNIKQGSETVAFTIGAVTEEQTLYTVQDIYLADGAAELSITMPGGKGLTLSLDDIALVYRFSP